MGHGEEMNVRARRIHWEIRLEVTNRTQTGEGKMVQLYYLVPGCAISMSTLYIYHSEYVQYGQLSEHLRSRTVLWLLRRGGATTDDFLGAREKI